ncbi:MAG: hypothetical protein HOV68_08040 [Streptomycetaceae bacterium]|nr:hypothetical protein [Streptomycetaceae bacterium]
MTRPTLKTVVDGVVVELPGTIADIRAALPEEQRDAFTEAIETAPINEVGRIAARWALPPEALAEDDEAFRSLEAGTFIPARYADEEPGDPS